MDRFDEMLYVVQSPKPRGHTENEELYDKSTNHSHLLANTIDPQGQSPMAMSPKPSMFFFSLNSPRQNTDHFHFHTSDNQNPNPYKQYIPPISRRLQFSQGQSCYEQQHEEEYQRAPLKQQDSLPPDSNQQPQKTKKVKKSKNNKGLKYLSVGVYDIVSQKGQTTYKEVANNLIQKTRGKVQAIKNKSQIGKFDKDQHNVKRRVYDALNVLISAQLLRKEGKKVICNYNLQKNPQKALRQKIKVKQTVTLVHLKKQQLEQKKKKLSQIKFKAQKIKKHLTRNRQDSKCFGETGKEKSVIYFPFVVTSSQPHHVRQINIGRADVSIVYEGNLVIMGDVDTLETLSP